MSEWKKVEETEAETWMPENEGDEVMGLLVEVVPNVGVNKSIIYKVETPDHNVLGVWGSTVLDAKMRNVAIGEEVRIVYLGMEKSDRRQGAKYKNYDVYHREVESDGEEDGED